MSNDGFFEVDRASVGRHATSRALGSYDPGDLMFVLVTPSVA